MRIRFLLRFRSARHRREARGPKRLMELISFQWLFAHFDVFECLDVFAQTTLPHRAFLRNSSITLRQLVRRIAGKHIVGHLKTLGCDDQSDHHLNAVAALVTGVSKPPDVLGILRWGTFKTGAREVIQERLVLGRKERAPALGEMIKQGLFCVRAVYHGIGKADGFPPDQSLRPEDQPERFAQTNDGANATRFLARSSDRG